MIIYSLSNLYNLIAHKHTFVCQSAGKPVQQKFPSSTNITTYDSAGQFRSVLCFYVNVTTECDFGNVKISVALDFMHTFVCTLADSGFLKNFLYQGGVKSTVSWVFEDLKFKISEGYDQNWCFPDIAQLADSVKLRQLTGQSQENTYFGRSLLKF